MYIAPTTKASKRHKVGDFVSVKITGADGHDLWGRGLIDGERRANAGGPASPRSSRSVRR
ncbi:MAG: Ribosomal protein S12p Asp88 (E. coli) methylthiotransferase (EC [uncultured Paraburkholderia sp.]|nr:MAG: Ribosomal protein S12p Asp88 (E. coli) methylthiotransferase (EC [uncultured Paraburkholderia sp.]CAH2943807.1 MAG: Ribosomal protein S12p Asp88 (E. coli) methylthiotransferase (EC [uncultured Paraburkholderia sp.]